MSEPGNLAFNSVSIVTNAGRGGFLRSFHSREINVVAASGQKRDAAPPAQMVSVPCTMVRFLQAMAEDGCGAQPWRVGPGCSAQHIRQRTLSL